MLMNLFNLKIILVGVDMKITLHTAQINSMSAISQLLLTPFQPNIKCRFLGSTTTTITTTQLHEQQQQQPQPQQPQPQTQQQLFCFFTELKLT